MQSFQESFPAQLPPFVSYATDAPLRSPPITGIGHHPDGPLQIVQFSMDDGGLV